MEANFRTLGILFVHAMNVYSWLEIASLKEAFEKTIYSIDFLVAGITEILPIQVWKSMLVWMLITVS